MVWIAASVLPKRNVVVIVPGWVNLTGYNEPGLAPPFGSRPISETHASSRITELDGLRGFAVCFVVLFHLLSRYDALYGHPELHIHFPSGRIGVDLFFMISGFVILMTLDRTKTLKEFVVSRFSRLYPAYWVAVFLTFAVVKIFGLPGRETTLPEGLINLTMVTSALKIRGVDGVYWSLQAELLFYVMMSVIVFSGNRKALIPILAVLTSLYSVLRFFVPDLHTLPFNLWAVLRVVDLPFIHLFLFGIVCYEARNKRIKNPYWLYALCLIPPIVEGPGLNLGVLLSFYALFGAASQLDFPIMRARWIVFIGTISYPLYLVHQNISYVILRGLYGVHTPDLVAILIALVSVLLLATALSFGVEQPAMRWIRDRYKNRQQPMPAAQPEV
jgi:peptidoglycan/LPS O-acetylase OafA/YrhL